MNWFSIFRVAAALAVASGTALWGGESSAASGTLHRYLLNSGAPCRLEDQSMEVEIQAKVPKLKKEGTMQGLKVVSATGQVAYRFLRFTGDKLVKTDVIARFLTAESEPPEHRGNIGMTPENYKFRYLRTADYQGATAYVYQLRPRKKRLGLYKGELWLDAESAMPVREAGEMAKSPSVFIRRVRFVRDYAGHGRVSCAQPERTSITVQTRIVGDAEMLVLQHPVDSGWQPPVAESVGEGIVPANGGN